MTIPNWITVGRFFCIPFVLYFLYTEQPLFALIFFAIAGVSDMLDGYLARTMKSKTELGAYLDPIADKTLFFTVFLMLSWFYYIPWWLFVLVVGRDILIVAGVAVLRLSGIEFSSTPSVISKINTFFLMLLVMSVLTFSAFQQEGLSIAMVEGGLTLLALFATFASGISYSWMGFKLLRGKFMAPILIGLFFAPYVYYLSVLQQEFKNFVHLVNVYLGGGQ